MCHKCWSKAAGFWNDTHSRVSRTFERVRADFRRGNTKVTTKTADAVDDRQMFSEKTVDVMSFLEEYLKHSQDFIPEDSECVMQAKGFKDDTKGLQRVHTDCANKRELWRLCCDHMRDDWLREGQSRKAEEMKQPVSVSQFRRVLHSKYHLVVHKHKHFAQCQVCFQLRNEARKARTTSDKEYIATNRRYHYEIIFKERVVYHTTRSDAMADPHKVLSAIVDGCSQWKTALPRYARDMKISNFKAYGQKLIGCLVHQDATDDDYSGGFFGYMADHETIQLGANATVEVRLRPPAVFVCRMFSAYVKGVVANSTTTASGQVTEIMAGRVSSAARQHNR